jgi:hypothetical protein
MYLDCNLHPIFLFCNALELSVEIDEFLVSKCKCVESVILGRINEEEVISKNKSMRPKNTYSNVHTCV